MTLGTIVILALVLGVAALVGWFLRGCLKQRGDRLITCPETLTNEAVRVDAGHAAVSGLMGHTDLRLSDCSRWPERQGCGQECLTEIKSAPDGCMIRTTVAKWYAGKTCAICGRPVGDREWMEHMPAMLDPRSPDRRTVTWDAVPPERILDVLATHEPICWNCHVAETFRHQHPELVIDRPAFDNGADPRR
jgi:hypothetical protein